MGICVLFMWSYSHECLCGSAVQTFGPSVTSINLIRLAFSRIQWEILQQFKKEIKN